MPVPLAIAAPAAIAGLAYLNARTHVGLDFEVLRSVFTARRGLAKREKAGRLNMFFMLEEYASNPSVAETVFLIYEGKSTTYRQTYDIVLRYGTWLKKHRHVNKGDIVAMVIGNSDTFVFIWFALWSIGAVPAFINYNLREKALVHSIRSSTSSLVIIDPEFSDYFEAAVRDELSSVTFVVFDGEEELRASGTKPERQPDADRFQDKASNMAMLIYTSGTTGLPKPAIVSWMKAAIGGLIMGKWINYSSKDTMYTAMPLYHTSASALGVCTTMNFAATICIGRKFSTKTFWVEARESKATIIQYVGETCRYLLSAPPSPLDKQHNIRLAFGNGLRPDVWNNFKERFGIQGIAEFYGATEGSGASFNYSLNDFTAGAIGRSGLLTRSLIGTNEIININHETNEPQRDLVTHLCIRSKVDQPGELLYKLDANDTTTGFQGYFRNPTASEAKILRDVVVKGDAYFRSGDVLRLDGEGRTYFCDRIGDTYRWKGENVSTTEVSEVFGRHHGVDDINVYGIDLPHHDGRAGCVQILLKKRQAGTVDDEAIMADLARFVSARLPRFAVPLFLRLSRDGSSMQVTGTNKQQKHVIRAEGVDPAKVVGDDEVWWLRNGVYVRFGRRDWDGLHGGSVKL